MSETPWLLLHYFTAVDLADGALLNIQQLEQALLSSSQTLAVVSLWDQARDVPDKSIPYASGGGSQPPWSTTGITRLIAGASPGTEATQSPYTIFAETNTGTEEALSNFLRDAYDYGSGASKILILSNHGGGILAGFNFDGPDYDNDSVEANLKIGHLRQAITGSSNPYYDILAFDECLMGSVEVAFELQGVARYLLASQDNVQGDGFPYNQALANLDGGPVPSPQAIGGRFVDSFRNAYSGDLGPKGNTLSLTDTSQLQAVASGIRSFVEAALAIDNPSFWSGAGRAAQWGTNYGEGATPYQDLAVFTKLVAALEEATPELRQASEQLSAALAAAVLANSIAVNGQPLSANQGSTPVAGGSYGLSIVMPSNYGQLLDMLGGKSVEHFIEQVYRPQAAGFLAATGWERLLTRMVERQVFVQAGANDADGSSNTRSRPQPEGPTQVTPSDSDHSFYLDAGAWIDTVEAIEAEEIQDFSTNTYELGFLAGDPTTGSQPLLVRDLVFSVFPFDSFGEGRLRLELVDVDGQGAETLIASLDTPIDEDGQFDPAALAPLWAERPVDDGLELRVSTDSREGLYYDLITTLRQVLPVPTALGSTSSQPIPLQDNDQLFAGEFLLAGSEAGRGERWFSFDTPRSVGESKVIELLSTSDAPLELEILELSSVDPGKVAARHTSSGHGGLSFEFAPQAGTSYLVRVSSPQPVSEAQDFGLRLSSWGATDAWLPLVNTGVSPVLNLADAGQLQLADWQEGALVANVALFNPLGSVQEIGALAADAPGQAIPWLRDTTASSDGSLNRHLANLLSTAPNLESFQRAVQSSEGKSIGGNNAALADLSALPAGFALYGNLEELGMVTSRDPLGSLDDLAGDTAFSLPGGAQVSISTGVFELAAVADLETELDVWAVNSGEGDLAWLFYNVDDLTGALLGNDGWLQPGEEGYAELAIERALNDGHAMGLAQGQAVAEVLDGEAGLYAMALVSRSTLQTGLGPPDSDQQVWFSVGAANADGRSHMVSLGQGVFGFEQSWGGGDNDFNDLIVSIDYA